MLVSPSPPQENLVCLCSLSSLASYYSSQDHCFPWMWILQYTGLKGGERNPDPGFNFCRLDITVIIKMISLPALLNVELCYSGVVWRAKRNGEETTGETLAGHWLMSSVLNHRTAEWFYAYFICISLNR